MKQNDHIPKDNALRQALRQRAERCTAENPVPADLEGLVMQRILRSKQQPATRRRSLLRLLPWSIAAALLVGFTLMKALYQLPHEGEKTLSPLPREGESLATLESSKQAGNFTSHEEEGKALAMLPSKGGEKTLSPLPLEGESLATLESSKQVGNFTSDEDGENTISPLSHEGESLATLESSQQAGGLPSLTGSEGNIGLTKCQAVLSDRSRTPLLRTGKVGDGSDGGGPEESSPIPPEKQALADIYLAEVALQVAYRKQAAEEAVRAYQAGITGEETQQPIIAF
ncbi:MAG: hypothetical protein IJ142_07235 [Bacteroidaceae bacterium]|nr:hypothetical protein [Bacteroidaceae bacterium]